MPDKITLGSMQRGKTARGLTVVIPPVARLNHVAVLDGSHHDPRVDPRRLLAMKLIRVVKPQDGIEVGDGRLALTTDPDPRCRNDHPKLS